MGRMADWFDEFENLPREGKLEILVPVAGFDYLKRITVGVEDEVPLTHFTTKEMRK